jgi:hypothetical protein
VQKRLLVFTLMAMFLWMAAGVRVGDCKAWPPKSLAFQIETSSWHTVLAVKGDGKVKMANRTVKFYQLNGVLFQTDSGLTQLPVTGSGYLNYEGIFEFSLSGTLSDGTINNGFYNLKGRLWPNGVGIAVVRMSEDATWGTSGNISITMVPPDTLDLFISP